VNMANLIFSPASNDPFASDPERDSEGEEAPPSSSDSQESLDADESTECKDSGESVDMEDSGIPVDFEEPSESEDSDAGIRRLKTLEAYCLLGDFAGRVFKHLRKGASELHRSLPGRVGELSRILKEEDQQSDGSTPYTSTLVTTVKYLSDGGMKLNLDMARLAIDAYCARNEVCHSEAGRLERAGDRGGLARYLEELNDSLVRILPDDQLEHMITWKQIISFYKDSPEGDDMSDNDRPGSPDPDLQAQPLFDVRRLPSASRQYPFDLGAFRASPESSPSKRLDRKNSDPTTASSSLGWAGDEPPPKRRRLNPEEAGKRDRGKEHHDRLAMNALHGLKALRDN
jgi:hypothetical protein